MTLELSAQEVECLIDCVAMAINYSGIQPYSLDYLLSMCEKLENLLEEQSAQSNTLYKGGEQHDD